MYSKIRYAGLFLLLSVSVSLAQFSAVSQLGVSGVADTGGPGQDNKLVKTGPDGKISESFLPESTSTRLSGFLYVDPLNGNDNAVDSGSILNPYETVTAALAQANSSGIEECKIFLCAPLHTGGADYDIDLSNYNNLKKITFSGVNHVQIARLISTQFREITLDGIGVDTFVGAVPGNVGDNRPVAYLRNGGYIHSVVSANSPDDDDTVVLVIYTDATLPMYENRPNVTCHSTVNASSIEYSGESVSNSLDRLRNRIPNGDFSPDSPDDRPLLWSPNEIDGGHFYWGPSLSATYWSEQKIRDYILGLDYINLSTLTDSYKTWDYITQYLQQNYVLQSMFEANNFLTGTDLLGYLKKSDFEAGINSTITNIVASELRAASSSVKSGVTNLIVDTFTSSDDISSAVDDKITSTLEDLWAEDGRPGDLDYIYTKFSRRVQEVVNESDYGSEFLTNDSFIDVDDYDAPTSTNLMFSSSVVLSNFVKFSDLGGKQATAIAVVEDGSVAAIIVTDGGKGYTDAPEVSISLPASGTGAEATASVAGGIVVDISVSNPGSGYADVPVVAIDSPSQTSEALSGEVSRLSDDLDALSATVEEHTQTLEELVSGGGGGGGGGEIVPGNYLPAIDNTFPDIDDGSSYIGWIVTPGLVVFSNMVSTNQIMGSKYSLTDDNPIDSESVDVTSDFTGMAIVQTPAENLDDPPVTSVAISAGQKDSLSIYQSNSIIQMSNGVVLVSGDEINISGDFSINEKTPIYGDRSEGAMVTIKAVPDISDPNNLYKFESWNDGNTDNPRIVIADSADIYYATFTSIMPTVPESSSVLCNVDVSSSDYSQGCVSATASGLLSTGTVITLVAKPRAGFEFDNWKVVYSTYGAFYFQNPYELELPDNSASVVCTAYFRKKEISEGKSVQISASVSSAGGTVSVNGEDASTYSSDTVHYNDYVIADSYEYTAPVVFSGGVTGDTRFTDNVEIGGSITGNTEFADNVEIAGDLKANTLEIGQSFSTLTSHIIGDEDEDIVMTLDDYLDEKKTYGSGITFGNNTTFGTNTVFGNSTVVAGSTFSNQNAIIPGVFDARGSKGASAFTVSNGTVNVFSNMNVSGNINVSGNANLQIANSGSEIHMYSPDNLYFVDPDTSNQEISLTEYLSKQEIAEYADYRIAMPAVYPGAVYELPTNGWNAKTINIYVYNSKPETDIYNERGLSRTNVIAFPRDWNPGKDICFNIISDTEISPMNYNALTVLQNDSYTGIYGEIDSEKTVTSGIPKWAVRYDHSGFNGGSSGSWITEASNLILPPKIDRSGMTMTNLIQRGPDLTVIIRIEGLPGINANMDPEQFYDAMNSEDQSRYGHDDYVSAGRSFCDFSLPFKVWMQKNENYDFAQVKCDEFDYTDNEYVFKNILSEALFAPGSMITNRAYTQFSPSNNNHLKDYQLSTVICRPGDCYMRTNFPASHRTTNEINESFGPVYGSWGNWMKITGEREVGDTGSGYATNYSFALASRVSTENGVPTAGYLHPDGWQDTPPDIVDDYKRIWMRAQKINSSGNVTDTSYSLISSVDDVMSYGSIPCGRDEFAHGAYIDRQGSDRILDDNDNVLIEGPGFEIPITIHYMPIACYYRICADLESLRDIPLLRSADRFKNYSLNLDMTESDPSILNQIVRIYGDNKTVFLVYRYSPIPPQE